MLLSYASMLIYLFTSKSSIWIPASGLNEQTKRIQQAPGCDCSLGHVNIVNNSGNFMKAPVCMCVHLSVYIYMHIKTSFKRWVGRCQLYIQPPLPLLRRCHRLASFILRNALTGGGWRRQSQTTAGKTHSYTTCRGGQKYHQIFT